MHIENNEQPSERAPENQLESVVAPTATVTAGAGPKQPRPSFLKRFLTSIWHEVVEKQVIHKLITLLFALLVFGFVYLQMVAHRNILTYMGVMLLMVLVYVEILVIRDHLWVIEGSMRESRKWRDIFFNQSSLRRQRLRKLVIVLFALAIFSFVYMKVPKQSNPVLSFMGIILMITMLYYEILTIRDEVAVMLQSITHNESQKELTRKAEYEKFLKPEAGKSTEAQNIVSSVEPHDAGKSVEAQDTVKSSESAGTDCPAEPQTTITSAESPDKDYPARTQAAYKSGKSKKSAKSGKAR